MKTLIFIMLFSITAYSAPKWGDDNPGNADPPNDNCAFCGDDEPEDEAPIDIDFADFALGCGFAVFVMSIYKPKSKSDDTRANKTE